MTHVHNSYVAAGTARPSPTAHPTTAATGSPTSTSPTSATTGSTATAPPTRTSRRRPRTPGATACSTTTTPSEFPANSSKENLQVTRPTSTSTPSSSPTTSSRTVGSWRRPPLGRGRALRRGRRQRAVPAAEPIRCRTGRSTLLPALPLRRLDLLPLPVRALHQRAGRAADHRPRHDPQDGRLEGRARPLLHPGDEGGAEEPRWRLPRHVRQVLGHNAAPGHGVQRGADQPLPEVPAVQEVRHGPGPRRRPAKCRPTT